MPPSESALAHTHSLGPDPMSPSESAHAHTYSLARAFTACLLKVVDMQVRKLSTPSPKDVDCIPCELYSLQDFE